MMNSIELFSGTGGLALGLQLSGFDYTALYEWDKDSCDNLNYNIQCTSVTAETSQDWLECLLNAME